jgi:hypothetical protein
MTSLKEILLGTTVLLLVMFGGITFLVSGYSTYNITSSQATIYSDSLELLENNFSSTVEEFQNLTQEEGSFNLNIATALGFAWNSAITFFRLIFSAPVIMTTVISDAASNSVFTFPSWVVPLIIGAFTIIAIIWLVSAVLGRSTDDT